MIYTHAAAALVAIVLGFAGAWKVQAWRWDAAEITRMENENEIRRLRARTMDRASADHETDRVKIKTEFQTIYSEVEHVIEKPIYRDVCLDADGLRLLQRATRSEPATGQPAPAVP